MAQILRNGHHRCVMGFVSLHPMSITYAFEISHFRILVLIAKQYCTDIVHKSLEYVIHIFMQIHA